MPLLADGEMQEMRDDSELRKLYTPQQVTLEGVQTFGWQDYKITELVIPHHHHKNAFEFHYVLNGSISFQIKGTQYVAKNGEVLVVFPDELHGTEISSLHGHKMYWFSLKQQPSILGLSPEGSALILDGLRHLPCRIIPGSPIMKDAVSESFSLACSPSLYHRQYAQAQMVSFLYQLIQNAKEVGEKSVSREIQNAIEYMNQQVQYGVLLSQVAQYSGFSLSHFKYKFKQEIGVSPADFFMGLRIDKAKQLLKQGLSVTETANALNFSSPNYFATAFHRTTDMTPTQYIQAKRSKAK